MAIKLPTTKLPAATQDPQNLIIYGLPKVNRYNILKTLTTKKLLLSYQNPSFSIHGNKYTGSG